MAKRTVLTVLVSLSLLVGGACGNGDDDTVDAAGGSSTTTTEAGASSTTTAAPSERQPAIWPDGDDGFPTPAAAASDFVRKVLGVPPVLGEFQAGDSRSGEMVVFSPGEDGTRRIPRSTLLLRKLGPSDGWFVIGAANEHVTIDEPDTLAEVPAATIEVSGRSRGFEGNTVVTAFVVGSPDRPLDEAITTTGAMAESLPYTVSIDLSGAPSGSTVVLLVRGGTGLETDPGEHSAIPVTIA